MQQFVRRLVSVTLVSFTLVLATIPISCKSSNDESAGGEGEGENAPAAEPQAPDVDHEQVQNAFWDMKGANQTEQLQNFEQEVNKYNQSEDHISVAAERKNDSDGKPTTVVTGYVDKDGQPGYNGNADKPVFRVVQTDTINGNNVPYEYLDGQGNVYYRGSRAAPATPFYTNFYYNWRAPVVPYY